MRQNAPLLRWRSPARLMLTLLLAGCGGAPSTPPEGASAVASAGGEEAPTPVLPAVPEDPLLLVTGDATELLVADVDALRDSPHFPMLRDWAVRFGCVSAAAPHWLLDRSELVIGASFPASDPAARRNHGLLLLRGELPPDAPALALSEGGALLGAAVAGAPLQREARGRFEVLTRGGLAAVLLREDLLAVGDRGPVEATLALADGERDDRLVDGEFYRAHVHDEPLQGHTARLLALPSAATREQLSRQLASVGARGLLRGLREGSISGAVDVADDLKVAIDAGYDAESSAHNAANAARQLYFQGNLLLRLTGMPRIFEQASAEADGAEVRYALSLPQAMVGRLRERVEWLLEAAREGRCNEAR